MVVLLIRISELSVESFIIRVFRQGSSEGFIKAFSDDPETLTNAFGKVERVLKLLYVTRLYLWPRFQIQVASILDRYRDISMLILRITNCVVFPFLFYDDI